jgi:hypothetical protein
MRVLDAQVLDGALILVLDRGPHELFGAKAAIARVLGCDLHLATPRMMRGVRHAPRKSGESALAFLARLVVLDAIGGTSAPEPVIIRRPMTGNPVFRGTRVPPAPPSRCSPTSAPRRSCATIIRRW